MIPHNGSWSVTPAPVAATPRTVDLEAAWPWEQELGQDSAEQDTWLVSFADILMLLLTLFVLLLAFKDGADATQPGHIANVTELVDVVVTVPLESAVAASAIPALESTAIPATTAVQEAVLIPAQVTTAEPQLAVAEQVSLSVTPVPVSAPEVAAPTQDSEALAESPSLPESNPEPLVVMTAIESLRIAKPGPTALVTMPNMPGMFGLPDMLTVSTPPVAEAGTTTDKSAEKLLADLQDSVLQGRVEVTVLPDSVHLEISDSILFTPASAALTANGEQLLDELAVTLKAHPYNLSVEGHTDNVPIQTARYPSNWELSSSRATEVTRRLIERGIAADRVRAVGYADTHPRADNATAAGKARNRRVSLVLMEQR